MNDEIIIRDALLSDIEEIAELTKQLYEVEYPIENKLCKNLKTPEDYFNSKEFKKDITAKKKQIKDGKKYKVIVAVYNEKIVGYTNGYIRKSLPSIDNTLYGDEIAVNKQFQKKGIGDALMNELIRWGKKKKATKMFINVFRENEPAMKKYMNIGFKERHVCLWKDI